MLANPPPPDIRARRVRCQERRTADMNEWPKLDGGEKATNGRNWVVDATAGSGNVIPESTNVTSLIVLTANSST